MHYSLCHYDKSLLVGSAYSYMLKEKLPSATVLVCIKSHFFDSSIYVGGGGDKILDIKIRSSYFLYISIWRSFWIRFMTSLEPRHLVNDRSLLRASIIKTQIIIIKIRIILSNAIKVNYTYFQVYNMGYFCSRRYS